MVAPQIRTRRGPKGAINNRVAAVAAQPADVGTNGIDWSVPAFRRADVTGHTGPVSVTFSCWF
jgi:hypothetical protein